VDREIAQVVVPAIENPVTYERRSQHPVAALIGNIINAVACDE